jgi:choline-sulfatase
VHDEVVTMATVDYINRLGVLKRSEGRTAPFCLTVGFMLPHPPYVARSEDYHLYRDRMTLPTKPEPSSSDVHPHLRWWRQHTGIEAVSEQEVLRARAAYWGLVTRLDAMIGQILSALDENGLADNTLIVYTSDHGDMLGEHRLWWKHTFYEESAKVPLIVSWPGVIPAGRRCDRVVSALDVTTTMLDALGAPPLPNAVGKSFLGLVAEGRDWPGGRVEWEDVAFSEYCTDRDGPREGCYQRMVRQGDWKLIYYHDQEPQLFNLADDPGELVDLARDPASIEIRQNLVDRVLDGWNPEQIADKMAAKREDKKILAAWARHAKPQDQFRWTLKPEMDYLDE